MSPTRHPSVAWYQQGTRVDHSPRIISPVPPAGYFSASYVFSTISNGRRESRAVLRSATRYSRWGTTSRPSRPPTTSLRPRVTTSPTRRPERYLRFMSGVYPPLSRCIRLSSSTRHSAGRLVALCMSSAPVALCWSSADMWARFRCTAHTRYVVQSNRTESGLRGRTTHPTKWCSSGRCGGPSPGEVPGRLHTAAFVALIGTSRYRS